MERGLALSSNIRMTYRSLILLLRPQGRWNIISSELKRVDAYGQYMNVIGAMRSEWLNNEENSELIKLATLCEDQETSTLFNRYANKRFFKNERDFWESEDKALQNYIKQMSDLKLLKAIKIASILDIPILYAENKKSALHITDQLQLEPEAKVTLVMNFTRHDEGTTYRLQLHIDDKLIETISSHQAMVLTFTPGSFILDHKIYFMDEGLGGQLLMPFLNKTSVAIPRRMEKDYFRKFILRNVAKVKINAEGFDIQDINSTPIPTIKVEKDIQGSHILSLLFKYGNIEYTPDDNTPDRVTLQETGNSFLFTRQLRNKRQEQHCLNLLRDTGTEVKPSGIISFPSLSTMISWLQSFAPHLREQGFDVIQPSSNVYYIGPLNVEQSDIWHGDWLQTDVTVVLDEGRLRIPFRDLRDTILRGEQDYILPSGERLFIPDEWLQRYSDMLLIGVPKGNGFQRHKSQMNIQNDDALPQEGKTGANHPHTNLPKEWKGLKKLNANLRPYQKTGFEWLWKNYEAGTGCCLSDEMGLGKTIQTIALLLEYKETARTAKQPLPGFLFTEEEMSGETCHDTGQHHVAEYHTSLVVAPASVTHNWHDELARFAPSLKVCTYTGDIEKRRDKRDNLMRWDVVLTTYRTLVNDIDFLSRQQFGILVFDESQAFKTSTSQIHKAVKSLNGLHSMALSGTPIENNLYELWSLMNVINPMLLGDKNSFQQAFASPITNKMEHTRTALLRRLITPYFLKRTKEEVLTDLPERQDEVVVCPMTEEQASEYAKELSKARNEWMDPTLSEQHRSVHILASIQRLRHIANGEGKMEVVFEHLENLRGTHHKILIFSEYVSLLEKVGNEMRQRGWPYDMLVGSTQHREQVIGHFQKDAECQFFLISLKAGGVGINLTAADYVFVLDPWWNQAAEEQAIARSHRIGQRHPVFVYRFVSEKTLEQQILTLQERKLSLIDSVMPFICVK